MKVSEITENFDQLRHSVEASVVTPNSIRINSAVKVIMKKYSTGEYSPSEALQYLEILHQEIQDLFHSDYFDWLINAIPRHFEQLQQDWISLENIIEKYINHVKNKHSLREDETLSKASNGELSPMSNRKVVTKKDKALDKVEQLFKESKK